MEFDKKPPIELRIFHEFCGVGLIVFGLILAMSGIARFVSMFDLFARLGVGLVSMVFGVGNLIYSEMLKKDYQEWLLKQQQPVHCPICQMETGVAIPKKCPHKKETT